MPTNEGYNPYPGCRLQLIFSVIILSQMPSQLIARQDVQVQMVSEEAVEAVADARELSRINVTGYHIKRIDIEGPAPVVVYDREMLDQSGVNTVQDFARYLTENMAVINDATINNNGGVPGTGRINLRGIGLDATLILVNGIRVAPYGLVQFPDEPFVDVNAIPMAAIDRIEVLKDGASAIYGADAVAGVVNIILRDHYEGVQITGGLQQTAHGDGSEWTADMVAGFTLDRTRFVFFLNHMNRDPIHDRDRKFAAEPDFSDIGGPNRRSIFSSPPSVRRNDTFRIEADPECGTDPLLSSVFVRGPNSTCRFNYNRFTDLIDETERTSAGLTINSEMASGARLFSDIFYNRADTFSVLAPSPLINSSLLPTPSGRPFVPANHPNNPFGVPMELFVRALDAGPRQFATEATAYRLMAGFENSRVGWDWRGTVMYSANEYVEEIFNGVLTTRYQDALLGLGGPDGNQYYNPFGHNPQNDPDLIDWFSLDAVRGADRTEISLDVTASTEFGTLSGGPIGLAAGVQYREQELEEWADESLLSGDIAGSAQTEVISADRDVISAYTELSLPLSNSVEAQVAARWERYNDFGSSTNPKIAVRWQPDPSWMLRGSWGTSFKPPVFQQLFDPPNQLVQPYIDRPRCDVTGAQQDCSFWFYDTVQSGNPELQPEEGVSWNLGGMWAPKNLAGLEIGLDFWKFRHKERIILFNPQLILDAGGDLGIIRGTPTQEDITNGAPARIVQVQRTFRNSDKLETRGFDTRIRYRFDTRNSGEFVLQLSHTYIDIYEFIDTNDSGLEAGFNFAGKTGPTSSSQAMPRNRANLSFIWSKGSNGANATVHYAGHYQNFANEYENGFQTDRPWIIRSHATLDLQYSHRFDSLRDARLRVGCQNCTDRNPPYTSDTDGQFLHDNRGEMLYLRWQQPL